MNWFDHRKRLVRRRRVLRFVCGGLVVLGGLLLIGAALPVVLIRRGTVILDRSPESVWLVLTDLDGMPRWRSDLTGLERIPDLEGRPAWKEFGPGGVRIFQLQTAERPHLLVMRRADGVGRRAVFRTVELTELRGRGGTEVRVTEAEELGNPVRRVLDRLWMRRLPRFLRDLAQMLGGHQRQVAIAPE